MCTGLEAIIPWITGASAVAGAVSSMNKPSIPDPPPAPKIEATPPAPTVLAASPRDQSALTESKDALRKKAAGMTSWLATNKTGGLGLAGQAAPTQKKTLLGGMSSTLG